MAHSRSSSSTNFMKVALLLTATLAVANAAGHVEVVDPTGKIDPLDCLKDSDWYKAYFDHFTSIINPWLSNPQNITGVDLNSKELSIDRFLYRTFSPLHEKAEMVANHVNNTMSEAKDLAASFKEEGEEL